MVEMILFIIGVYTLVFGRLSLPWNLSLQGWRARLASFFFLAPLPALILLSRTIGQGLPPDKGQQVFGLTELVVVILAVSGAILFAWLTRPIIQSDQE